MNSPGLDAAYWSQNAGALSAALGSSPGGLSSETAAAKLHVVGLNSIEDAAKLTALRLLLRQFESPLVLILIFAAVVSLVLQQWVDSAIILAIVLGSALLGFFQGYQASKAVEELKHQLALTCRVIRDGAELVVPVTTVVPGDLILLSAGNLIPADGLVIEAADFLVSEASIDRRVLPRRKEAWDREAGGGAFGSDQCGLSRRLGPKRHREGPRRRNRSANGVRGNRGAASGPAARDGLRTRCAPVRVSPDPRDGRHCPVCPDGKPAPPSAADQSLLFAVALAVGMSPELLPMIVSVTLSAGARAMARRGVIVRRLDAIENLGSMDILCTDKTGTLTEGTIVLSDALDARNRPSNAVGRLAFLNAAFETGIENPLDAAIVAKGKSAALTTQGVTKIDEIPYDFLRRRLTIVVAEEGNSTQHLIVTKGAFSNVLDNCTLIERDAVEIPLTTERRAELDAVFEAKGAEGFRVLAVATRRVAAKPHYSREDRAGDDLSRLSGLLRPAQAGRETYDPRSCPAWHPHQGDQRRQPLCDGSSGRGRWPHSKSMLTGGDLEKLKDEALWHLAPRTDLFVEIDPQQKERIVRALQRTGHSVGYLGDGINDAPALHTADVGISVAEAVDVARESADIILLEPRARCLA